MILELGSILTNYVRQHSFPCISHFSGHGSYTLPGTFNQSPLEIQYPKLVCTLRKFQEGRKVTRPFCWACAQGRYGPGISMPYTFQTLTVSILPPHSRFKGSLKGKVLPRCGRKRAPSDSITFSLSLLVFVFALLVCFAFKF